MEAIDKGIQVVKEKELRRNEIRAGAAREILDMYIDFYKEDAKEEFMQQIAHKFSY